MHAVHTIKRVNLCISVLPHSIHLAPLTLEIFSSIARPVFPSLLCSTVEIVAELYLHLAQFSFAQRINSHVMHTHTHTHAFMQLLSIDYHHILLNADLTAHFAHSQTHTHTPKRYSYASRWHFLRSENRFSLVCVIINA